MPILNWLDREKDVKAAKSVPYRLLELDPKLSYGDDEAENMLIQGDNLEALKALLPYYAGQAKCIFIDPPYNTHSAFEHYDDNLEHTKWLSMMYPRLELLRELLAEDGSIWVTIDDNEGHYLKVIMDEVFGRNNFITSVAWQKFHSVKANSQYKISASHDHIFAYRKSEELQDFNLIPMDEDALKIYKNLDDDPRGRWRTAPLTVSLLSGQRGQQYAKTGTSSGLYEITSPNGKKHWPTKGRCWLSKEYIEELKNDNRIWWGKDGNAVPMKKIFLSEQGGTKISNTFWKHDEVGSNKKANDEQKQLFKEDNSFGTPKPEGLMERIFHLATNEGDLVLDSFLGSGTSSAVAHKMKRKYIGIEMGEHAESYCYPRLKAVIDGEQGGISANVEWAGGGGFKFYRLGKAVFDAEGRIKQGIKFEHLAAHIWFSETKQALKKKAENPLLGVHENVAYYLLYNDVLGDKKPQGSNVLTSRILCDLPPHDGQKVIYGESSRIGAARLKRENIIFKQTPYDVKAR